MSIRRSHVLAPLIVLGAALFAESGVAAPPLSPSEPLPSPGKSVATDDDASAVAVNPANLAFVPDPELRWMWTYTGELADLPMRGHAIDVAAPLWFFGTGLRVELHNPPFGAPPPFSRNYQWIRWGVAGRVDDWLGVGAGLGWSLSDSQRLDGQFGLTLGFTLRPSQYVSWSGLVRDVNAPTSRDDITSSFRSWETGIAVRPIDGRRDFELGIEGRFYDQLGNGTARATVGVDIPYVGRLRGDVKLADMDFEDPQLVATAGLDVNFGPLQVSGGALFGNGIGFDNSGFYVGAAMRRYREPGIPFGKRVARIDINDTPGDRGHVQLLRRLWRLAKNDEIEGVVLVMKDEPAYSIAHAEELGDAIRTLRANGKKVACHLEDAGGKALFVCSQADRVGINPAGGVRFAGLSARYFYFGGTLDKLGVKADFVRIGPHKSAAEQFTMSKATDVAHADHQDFVNEAEDVLIHDVGGGRKISRAQMKKTLAKGPFLAREAREEGLVDNLVYPDEIDRFMDEVMGGDATVMKSLPVTEAPKRWGRDEKVAIVYLSGDMVDGESQFIPYLNIRLAGSRTISAALKSARDDPSVKAVVFRIETGGGSSLAADVILREAQLTAKKKPFVVSMGSAAASGGYYVSAPAPMIYANRSTVTGSIGIFYGKVDVTGLMSKLGVGSDAVRSTPRADAESLFRPFSEEERVVLTEKVKQFYDLFIARVAEGRKMKPEEVDAVGRGRVWSGRQAKERKLVDRVGGLREALEEARHQADLADDVAIIELPEEDDSLLGFLLKLVGFSHAQAGAGAVAFLPPALLDVARALSPFLVYDPSEPLARVEVFEEAGFPASFRAAPDDDSDAIDGAELTE
ncbi:MAG: signal peptide peptidase SppA [Polyangiaceae bacterium]|nr:signal peptide peptidase SppA [Polyangiaceae bacterium]